MRNGECDGDVSMEVVPSSRLHGAMRRRHVAVAWSIVDVVYRTVVRRERVGEFMVGNEGHEHCLHHLAHVSCLVLLIVDEICGCRCN